jgi:hypothetical protein
MTHLQITLLLFSLSATINLQSQDYTTLQGSVVDFETKDFLVGASICISGTAIGTQSDMSGRFTLNVPNKSVSDSLIVTYVGYKKYGEPILRVKDKDNLQIKMIRRPGNRFLPLMKTLPIAEGALCRTIPFRFQWMISSEEQMRLRTFHLTLLLSTAN